MRLAVLGAGNLNDVDLHPLLQRFHQITLLDWDRNAVVAGVERQAKVHEDLWPSDRIEIPPAIDLSTHSSELQSLEPFQVIASVGLLSQMIERELAQLAGLGVNDPVVISERLHHVRTRHFEIIDRMLSPEGTALLTTEFVSSDTLPGLAQVPEEQLAPVLRDAMLAGNFFSGMQPASVLDSARQVFQAGHRRIEPGTPWLWDFGPRTYAVVPYFILPPRRSISPRH
ncbi:hypothetical protein Pla52n_23660 [Stieleria varia]|uniref:Uncharacterized protein n=2 Tax=Stieleria varia TaxID=2528005 RepID=A0A5C6AZA5_9BACT|nr:hypothetical protein Pla52n_23660 [Stieleria varia]